MVYNLFIQMQGCEDVETIRLTDISDWVLRSQIEGACNGYTCSEKELKALRNAKSILIKTPAGIKYELALA